MVFYEQWVQIIFTLAFSTAVTGKNTKILFKIKVIKWYFFSFFFHLAGYAKKKIQNVKIRGSFFLALEYHFGVFLLVSVALQDDTGTFSLTSSRHWRHFTHAEVNQKTISLIITERSYCPNCLPQIQYRSGEHQTVTQFTCQYSLVLLAALFQHSIQEMFAAGL